MLSTSQKHQVLTSRRRSRMTSLLVTPVYVMLVVLFVWCFQLHSELKASKMERLAAAGDSPVLRVRRAAEGSIEQSVESFLNMLPSPSASNLMYDMELEPCGGAIFTVWGRSVCPEESASELVYDGIVGGTNVDSSGGGVDYLCLSRDPQWFPISGSALTSDSSATSGRARRRGRHAPVNAKPTATEKPYSSIIVTAIGDVSASTPVPSADSHEDSTRLITRDELLSLLLGTAGDVTLPTTSAPEIHKDAYLYGTEYHGNELKFQRDNLAADTFVDQDAVCAVCRSKLRMSALMIPGRRECYAGWTKEYEGFLMAGPVGVRAQHRFVCVHHAPEAAHAGWRHEAGAVFYHVRAMCGSLPCPTYIQDRELSCVVCTK